MVAAGGRPEKACSWKTLCDLQVCISEPVRIIHYYTLDVVRRLFYNRGMARGRESARGTERETANTADQRTGEKVSPSTNCDDYNQQWADDDYRGDGNSHADDDDLHGSDNDEFTSYEDYDDDAEVDLGPPPSFAITYDGDSPNLDMAYCFSRYLVELLSVRPRFPFDGTFGCFNGRSAYYSAYYYSRKGQHNLDSQGNLILRAQGGAIEDFFQIRVEIPEDDNKIEDANFVFRVDPYACNQVITRTIPTARGREIDVAFVALYCAIQANVFINLDLIGCGYSSTGGTIYYVYGEVTAHHQLYDDKNVMLFFREEEDKAKVIDGKLPQLRTWAAVPVYLDPLLIIKVRLHVSTNPEHDRDGHTILFEGDLTFDRDQYEKSICNVHHGEVKVQISYE